MPVHAPNPNRRGTRQKERRVASRALAKGLQLLEVLSSAQAALTLGELAEMIDLGKPSTLRLLSTLVATGFAAKDGAGNYLASRRVIEPVAGDPLARLIDAARGPMEELNADLAETVSMAALYDDHIRVVQSIESPQHIRMVNYPGRILPPYASSLGKAIAAYQSAERLQLLLLTYGIYQTTEYTITAPVRIREEMALTRERGYSAEFEETVRDGCCFGAPIQERGGIVRASISVSVPKLRLSEALQKTIPERIVAAAKKIGERL